MPTLDFKGKPLIYVHHLTVPSRTLEPDAPKSLPPKDQQPSLDYRVRPEQRPRRTHRQAGEAKAENSGRLRHA